MNITKDAKSIARLEHMNTTKIQNKVSLFFFELTTIIIDIKAAHSMLHNV